MAATTADLVNKFLELDDARKGHEGSIDKLKEQLAELEPEIIKRLQDAGFQSIKSASGKTVYIERKLWGSAKDGNHAGLCGALKTMGLETMVKEDVNHQTLSSWVREQEEEVSPKLPLAPEVLLVKLNPIVQPYLNIAEVFKLRARKG